MRSPNEVAAARAEYFNEFQARLGRFAGGADLSKRYARELHDWLARHHHGDDDVARVLAVLREYPARVGQVEAREACGDLLANARRRVEGERFDWHSVPGDREAAWRDAFASAAPGVNVPRPCPLCGRSALRRYFRSYAVDRGGSWEWCSSCLRFEHFRARVPAWWEGSQLLDRVPMSVLEHSPEFLERALRLAGDRPADDRRHGDRG
jgi:hypothetical protein